MWIRTLGWRRKSLMDRIWENDRIWNSVIIFVFVALALTATAAITGFSVFDALDRAMDNFGAIMRHWR